ncbi:AT-RICH INTERACTIVE DOMAIN-CONTAINING PROTEIN 2 [Salix koriyanagi]|uniref:AT-RICH INTERACTIVE DOMAIN-CONTAINING PROTEIN 2 n=1 Tax=Salix koriyanagi TaxID=2511006 RepID=A0A9Q0PWJ4_9ROSI|nr:AT-RICH INTERACTIVE DOMAIN-CONTAINING PROTEIN 2 [Salix koriyanagi]
MCPSMFEDVSFPSEQSAKRSRCSKRLPAPEKPQLCYCCNSCSAHRSKSASLLKTKCENACKEQEHALKVQELVIDDLSSKHTTLSGSEDKHVRRHVAVGPLFQAEVPEWTGMVSESASKWLGTRFWPSKYENHNVPVAMDPIGKGGISLCGCQLPGSVGCARFHTAEKRMKLKLELGSFVLSLAVEPSICRQVLLGQQKSYQNRVTPKYTDSDDDDETKQELRWSHERCSCEHYHCGRSFPDKLGSLELHDILKVPSRCFSSCGGGRSSCLCNGTTFLLVRVLLAV